MPALTGVWTAMKAASSGSAVVSPAIAIDTDVAVSPGAKVTVPDALVKSAGVVAVYASVDQLTETGCALGADSVTGTLTFCEPALPSVTVAPPGTTLGRRAAMIQLLAEVVRIVIWMSPPPEGAKSRPATHAPPPAG